MNVRAVALVALVAPSISGCFSLFTDTSDLEGTRPSDGGAASDAYVADAPASAMLDKKYTEFLGRFVGTPTSPLAPGLAKVDLGVTFPAQGKLTVLFGDNWGTNDDSVGFAPITYPKTGLPAVAWLTSGAAFAPLRVASVDLGKRNVPVEGIFTGTKSYVFFATGWSSSTSTYSGSALAHSTGPLSTLDLDFAVASSHFVNVSLVQDGANVWIFGSGAKFRQSPIHLAKAPLATLGDRKTWQFFDAGTFIADENAAAPLIDHACVGELSVRKHPRTGVLIMAYNCEVPRGILVRTALQPIGPWSDPIVAMDSTAADSGFGRTMHTSSAAAMVDDGLSDDRTREDESGHEYGPYLVPEWFDATATPDGTFAIVYTMSTSNPYTVSLMRTVLGTPGVAAAPQKKGVGLPKATIANGNFSGGTSGWTQTGDSFRVFVGPDGKQRLTTSHLVKGDSGTGTLYQDFTIDASTSKLTFLIQGGDASVKLMRGTEVLRQSWGRRDNDHDFKVSWNVEDFRGDTVRLLIEDTLTGAWGFVGVSAFALE